MNLACICFCFFHLPLIYMQLSEKIDGVNAKVAALFESFNLMMDEQKKLKEVARFEELKEWLTNISMKERKRKEAEEKL